jgi:hypothetical protein
MLVNKDRKVIAVLMDAVQMAVSADRKTASRCRELEVEDVALVFELYSD